MSSKPLLPKQTPTFREDLSLDGQLCIAIYQAANKAARLYRHVLEFSDLTFSQYQALIALWDRGTSTVGDLCSALDLETSTLTPVLKRLEALGYILRFRDRVDERRVYIALTEKGQAFRSEAVDVRCRIIDLVGMPISEIDDLRRKLQQLSVAIDRALLDERSH